MKKQTLPQLSKWPFFLGDGFFLGLAILLAWFAPKPYNAVTASSIILSGVFAFLFFAVPFIVEYLARLQCANNQMEETADKQFTHYQRILDELNSVVRTLTGLAQKSAETTARLRELDPLLDEKINTFDASLSQSLGKLEAETAKTLNALRETQTKELENLFSKLKATHNQIEDLFLKAENASMEADQRLEVMVERLDRLSGATSDPAGEEKPGLETRSASPSSTAAGEGSKTEGESDTKDPFEEGSGKREEEPLEEGEEKGEEEGNGEKGGEILQQAGLWTDLSESETPEPPEAGEAERVENPDAVFDDDEIPEPEPAPGSRAPFKIPAADPTSLTLIAHANIGIGNTPYVRGEGPGLSWTEGLPMDFVEIGKWEWTVENAAEAANVRVFKNDKLSAYGDDIEIGIGERVEIYPKFPEDDE